MYDRKWALNLIKSASFIAYPQKDLFGEEVTPSFRREFNISCAIKKAELVSSGLGVYEVLLNGIRPLAEINGEKINIELKPGYTQVLDKKVCNRFDVTSLLKVGNNCISAISSSGWWSDLIADNIGRYPAFICALFIEYENGEITVIKTDESFKVTKISPLKFASIYDGESYDARISNDFMLAGFDDSSWENACISTQFSGELAFEDEAIIVARKDLVRKPIKINAYTKVKGQTEEKFGVLDGVRVIKDFPFTLKKGERVVIDFGQNASGRENFTVEGESGTVITVRHAEILNDNEGQRSRGNDGAEGSLYLANLRTAKATTTYVIGKNDIKESYKPLFTYYGFRYIDITATSDVTFYSLDAETLTSVVKDSGFITTGNPLVNRLIENARWGMYSNYLSIPTDCPQRDERYGWSADTQIFSATAGYLSTSSFGFLEKWMRDMRIAQEPSGAFPAIAPRARFGNTMGDVGWADAGIIVPYNVWKLSGDERIVRENYHSMKKYMDFFLKRRKNQGPLPRYGDWLSFEDNSEELQKYLGVCFYAYDALLMSEMAEGLGIEEDKKLYLSVYEEQKKYFIENYVSEDGFLNFSVQTALLYALKLNLLPNEESVKKAKEQLLENFNKNKNKLQTGFLGAAIILPTLSKVGLNETAYSLLLCEEMPSWLFSVKQGATTIWERWNSYSLEYGFGDVGMNSFNHYAYGCAVEWLFGYSAGIRPKKAGFNEFMLAPCPDKRLGFVKAEYRTCNGVIKSEWTCQGDKVIYRFSIPQNTSATFINPITGEGKHLSTGTYEFIT